MTATATPMTTAEWDSLVAIAATLWPHERAFFAATAGVPSPRETWYLTLRRFDHRDVGAGLERLAETSERFPALAQLVAATKGAWDVRERRDQEPLRLTPPVAKKTEQQLADFDRAGAELRAEWQAEAALYCRRYKCPPEHTTRLTADIETACNGLVWRVARMVLAREISGDQAMRRVAEGMAAVMSDAPPARRPDERPVAEVVTAAALDHVPRSVETAPVQIIDTTAVVLSDDEINRRALDVLRRLDEGEVILPATVEEPVRERVRQLRRARQDQTPPATVPAGG